jgi:hypothetical protein
MNKKLLRSTCLRKSLLMSAFCLASGINSNAQTITLFRTGVIVPPSFSTLGAAIAAALPGDSLVLSKNVFKEANLSISKNLKITGTVDSSGISTIDPESNSRGLLITAGNVDIKNLLITKGKVNNEAGGGICNYGTGALTLSGYSGVSNSSCTGLFARGGGIYSGGKLSIIDNAYVSGNSADEEGGGVYAYSTFVLAGNAKISNNTAKGSGGGVFSQANGGAQISGFSKIENNTANVAGGGLFGVGTIQNQASISNNKADFGGGIAGFNDILFLYDTATISNNTALTAGGGIWLNNCGLYGYDLFHITNNKILPSTGGTNYGGAIYNVNGSILVTGGVIMGNQSPVSAVYNTSGATPTNVKFNSTHFFNPKADGTRQAEIFNSPSLTSSIINFTSDYCWWGQNDTLNLIANRAGTNSGTITSYVILTWLLNNGNPIDPLAFKFPLSADFRLNDGTKMDSLTLRSIKGVFTSDKGKFSPSTSYIDTINYVRSVFLAPVGADSVSVMAYVDADTFRSEKIAMVGLSVTNKNLTSSIKVYPNPATESINVADAATGTKITVYSLDGRMIHQQISSSNIENIKLSNQAAGTYILQLIDPNGQKASTKIIKQ